MTLQFLETNGVVPVYLSLKTPREPAITPAGTKVRKGITSFAIVTPHQHYAEWDATI